jgi:dienelactone hydrolase
MNQKMSTSRAQAIPKILIAAICAATVPLADYRADASDATFAPPYRKITHFTLTIAADGDRADVYFPQSPRGRRHTDELPIALLLPGALVDKADYSNFASQVARYGFVVVVPNNQRTLVGPNGQAFPGLFAEQEQVNQVLAQMRVEDRNPVSPIFKIVDTSKLGLLGHSFGGGAGLGATQKEFCLPGICSGTYTRPPELKAGIFYGANFRNQQTQQFVPINNDGIPIGLIVGSRDGVALPASSLITVAGANHYSITNQDNPAREPNRATLDQSIATGTIARWSGAFLRATMLDDRRALDYVLSVGDTLDPYVTVIR